MEMRPMEEGDIPQVLALQGQLGFQQWTPRHFLDEIQASNCFSWVLDNGRIEGYGILRCMQDEAELMSIALHPALRGVGHAFRLLGHLLDLARGAGVQVVYLEVHEENSPAQRLYTRHGFAQAGRRPRYYPDGGAALLFRKEFM